MNIDQLLRKNIANLKPYSSARDEFAGSEGVFLDANENPFNEPFNRYPDPYQLKLKTEIAKLKQVEVNQIFLGNGSDEAIDLLFRSVAEPGVDNVVTIAPTYGMYQVAADINNVEVRTVNLDNNFQLDVDKVLSATDENTKMVFLCSPNNPTGNDLDRKEMMRLIESFDGLVIVDEAYIDFSEQASMLNEVDSYANLVVLQTFSKAWGMAGLRLGMAFASAELIAVLNKVKYPYNLNILTQEKALELISRKAQVDEWIDILLKEREALAKQLQKLNFVTKVFDSDANFILVKTTDADGIYNQLVEQQIIIRNRNRVILCDECLRISIGTPEENKQLMDALLKLEK
ncbi:histidinol-phosphate transaminase [Prolixibacteraceae bacterium JC049]|nr:histidinol-phosphate transaminase [Prolixibacteraceae bacterium JC049]